VCCHVRFEVNFLLALVVVGRDEVRCYGISFWNLASVGVGDCLHF
jgi:hypothetical protein